MPQVGFGATKVTREDREAADALAGHASGYARKVRHELDLLENFMDANREEFTRNRTPSHRIYALFAVQWLGSGRSPTTLNGMLGNFTKFHVDPFNIDQARDGATRFELSNAIARMAVVAERRFVRQHLDEIVFPSAAPADLNMVDRWSFWGLLIVTGNRPNNVIQATIEKSDGTGVNVYWRMRKVHKNIRIRYPFHWSKQPPPWMITRWSMLASQPWPWKKPENIASYVNKWLPGMGYKQGITSTSPRGTLDTFLRSMVRGGMLDAVDYSRIIDHDYATGLDYYANGALDVEE